MRGYRGYSGDADILINKALRQNSRLAHQNTKLQKEIRELINRNKKLIRNLRSIYKNQVQLK